MLLTILVTIDIALSTVTLLTFMECRERDEMNERIEEVFAEIRREMEEEG